MSTDQAISATNETDTFKLPPFEHRASSLLRSGDRMNREEFHRLYEQTPDGFKAELIEGVVYVASPVSLFHGVSHSQFSSLLATYAGRTSGTEGGDNTTVLLGEEGEPQPDLFLRILPEHGGQSRTTDDGKYIEGAPELVAEVAYSSRAIDLHGKKNDYTRYGVKEYLVLNIKDEKLHHLDLPSGKELSPDEQGIFRSQVFPGLWINSQALLEKNHVAMIETLEAGLATDEHAAFVQSLAERKK